MELSVPVQDQVSPDGLAARSGIAASMIERACSLVSGGIYRSLVNPRSMESVIALDRAGCQIPAESSQAGCRRVFTLAIGRCRGTHVKSGYAAWEHEMQIRLRTCLDGGSLSRVLYAPYAELTTT